MLKLERFLKRKLLRGAKTETRQVSLALIKAAVTAQLQPFHSTQGEIIDVDIPALTTELVDIKIYTRSTKERGQER